MSELGIQLRELRARLDRLSDTADMPDDGRHEPRLAGEVWFDEIDEPRRLDPERMDFGSVPPPPRRSVWRGPLGSLLLHLLPFLVLIGWPKTPVDVTPPIPIQLVIEEPPPPPPPPPPKPAPTITAPPPGLRSSEETGEVGSSRLEKGRDAAPQAPTTPQPPDTDKQSAPTPEPTQPTDQATEEPHPKPGEAKALAAETAPPPPPRPAPPKQQAAVHAPKPEGWLLPLDGERPHAATHSARVPGPDATRDEYCAYALTLTMRHIDLLPLSLLGARHGDTYVAIRVFQDGTVRDVTVLHGSGYIDIDERVEQMVKAVGRFPPLPQWITSPYMDFTFHLHFPHPAER